MNPSAIIKPESLPNLLEVYANAGIPLFIQGAPGIGKSAIVADFARRRAQKTARRFHAWHEAGFNENEGVATDPSKVFLFHDVRISTS